ncbi:MAG: hypothetical protein IPL79_19715 [Myxococcales bacterium]|nr:hypothetical protein [Myxococcales bacterium]
MTQANSRVLVSAMMMAASLTAACGLGLSESPAGGYDNLPSSGIGPYVRPPDVFETPNQEPWILTELQADLAEPWIMPRGDGGFRIWYSRQESGQAAPREIWYAEFANYAQPPDVAPSRVLGPTRPWEATEIGTPSVIEIGGQLRMFYTGGDEASSVGMATSSDDGATWTAEADPILSDVRSPSVAVVGDELWLVAERIDMPGIWRAKAPVADPEAWVFDAEPIATARGEVEDAFDRAIVGSPTIVARTTSAGRVLVGVWFTGLTDVVNSDTASVGYVGTFDGITWERYSTSRPVLAAPGREPSLVVGTRTGIMAFSGQKGARSGIALAVHPSPQ